MLPFCDRHVSVSCKDVAPVWTRSFPISKEPKTLGEHLKKKRFGKGVRQEEAAQILGVSARTLSLWECDRLFPTALYHPKIVAYMGYDPFKILTK
jgi:DNA-binding XRE family transcriptional regulator